MFSRLARSAPVVSRRAFSSARPVLSDVLQVVRRPGASRSADPVRSSTATRRTTTRPSPSPSRRQRVQKLDRRFGSKILLQALISSALDREERGSYVELVVDLDHRSVRAGPETLDLDDGKLLVLGRLSESDT